MDYSAHFVKKLLLQFVVYHFNTLNVYYKHTEDIIWTFDDQ